MYAEILVEAIAIQRGGFDTSIINYLAREQWNLGAVRLLKQQRQLRSLLRTSTIPPLYI
jgi:hypothetical protein